MDQGEEIKARINIVVREWNRLSELAKGAAGNPDVEAVDPNDPTGGNYNDSLDWKDLGDDFPAEN